MTAAQFLTDGPAKADLTLALVHGAGAPMDSPFMAAFAEGLAAKGFRVVRFEFPYMAARRQTGVRKPPDSMPVLVDTWRAVIAKLGAERLAIGGKSLGGRVASMIADESRVRGLICLGYPFHPVGKPDRLRIEHLRNLRTPTLILQGERDALGNRAEVAGYKLAPGTQVQWIPDGDHSFRPRKSSGRTERQNWDAAVEAAEKFLKRL